MSVPEQANHSKGANKQATDGGVQNHEKKALVCIINSSSKLESTKRKSDRNVCS
jgi:hypothetical protein